MPKAMPVTKNISKSIVVNHNRKANIIQSYGRYNDIMSHENFEQAYEEVLSGALSNCNL